MTPHDPDTFKTPTQVQAERLADLEARLQLANEAYYFLMADRNGLRAQVELLNRRLAKESKP